MWYSFFKKQALRKNNLRVDLRVYGSTEEAPLDDMNMQQRAKSLISSAIIKGLDVIGIVSKFGIKFGQIANSIATSNKVDLKVIPGLDYKTTDNYHLILFNLQKNIQPGKDYLSVVKEVKQNKGIIMAYNLTKSQSKKLNDYNNTEFKPDCVEIYNAYTKVFKDLKTDYPTFMNSCARSGSELEKTSLWTEVERNKMAEIGFLQPEEGTDYIPEYLRGIN